jgi:hypothetical protein
MARHSFRQMSLADPFCDMRRKRSEYLDALSKCIELDSAQIVSPRLSQPSS